MTDRKGAIKFKGNDMTLAGAELKVGAMAPDFKLKAIDMSDKTLADYKGKTAIVSIVPSLDTPVCDIQTRKFNEKAGDLKDTVVLTVSMDLPMAQKRWCGAAGASNVTTLSDYKDHSFGKDWGVRIVELGLLARAVYVLDQTGKVTYAQIVPEVTHEPDYDAAIAAAKKTAG